MLAKYLQNVTKVLYGMKIVQYTNLQKDKFAQAASLYPSFKTDKH